MESAMTTGPEKPDVGFGGTYLYCVAEGGVDFGFAATGLEGRAVYTISHRDLVVVASDPPASPSGLKDASAGEKWMVTHQLVVDKAMERFGSVLPFGFGRIIAGGDGVKQVREWLRSSYPALRGRLERIKGKAEYVVQVFWDQDVMKRRLTREVPRIVELTRTAAEKTGGTAFMYGAKLEKALDEELAARANGYFTALYSGVRALGCEVRVDRLYESEEKGRMIINLSCLLSDGRVRDVGELLENTEGEEGLCVRFTGPWPPYSFV